MEVMLPGDTVNATTPFKRLGPGLRQLPDGTTFATTPGQLCTSGSTGWLSRTSGGRYVPAVGDSVVAQVVGRLGSEGYRCELGCASSATLDALGFPGANRKNRPVLHAGALVYARVVATGPANDLEITCLPAEGSSDVDAFGVLVGAGTQAGHIATHLTNGGVGVDETGLLVRKVPSDICRRLLTADDELLPTISGAVTPTHGGLEICTGANNTLWIRTDATADARVALWVRDAILATGRLDSAEVRKWIKENAKKLP
ncbi:exosome non-catalytic core subunit rrp40 [Savitreella phatthalungensis]